MRKRVSYKLLEADVAVQDALESCERTIRNLQRRLALDAAAQSAGSYRYHRTQRDLDSILYALDRVGLMTPPPEPPPIPRVKRLKKPPPPPPALAPDDDGDAPVPAGVSPAPTAPEKALE